MFFSKNHKNGHPKNGFIAFLICGQSWGRGGGCQIYIQRILNSTHFLYARSNSQIAAASPSNYKNCSIYQKLCIMLKAKNWNFEQIKIKILVCWSFFEKNMNFKKPPPASHPALRRKQNGHHLLSTHHPPVGSLGSLGLLVLLGLLCLKVFQVLWGKDSRYSPRILSLEWKNRAEV